MPLAEASIKIAMEVKANGEVSRMRNHKGNMPSLPQTKYCALCPAKFTRTTHLNRHLRSHTNERAHRCNTCNAEFTRSDLLTRHKRTCGDSSNANKSRRKSCQACAESKVKCNLQQPCSKCAARGRDCVFINDPEASRNRRMAKKVAHSSVSTSPAESVPPESPTSMSSLGPSSPVDAFSVASHGSEHSYLSSSHSNTSVLPRPSYSLPSMSNPSDCSSSVCSSQSSPRLDFLEQRSLPNSFHGRFNTMGLDSGFGDMYSNALNPPMENTFPSSVHRVHLETDLSSSWFETTHHSAAYGGAEPNLYNHPHCQTNDQDFVNPFTNLTRHPASSGKTSFSRQHFTTISPTQNAASLPSSSASRIPMAEELDHYLYLFFTEYSVQIPLIHRPTWKLENTHPILLSSMQACGALLVKTQPAMDFIIKTLTSSRDALIVEFSKPSCTLTDHMNFVLAVVLLQSIVAFQPRPDQRALSKSYQELLVMMIRKIGLIKLVSIWAPPDLSNPHVVDSAWKDWVRYETFKRALALAFLQDCSHCIYYSSSPTFTAAEFNINLPCDDTIWRCQTSREWYQTQTMFSAYGTGAARLLGMGMQMAVAALKDPSSSAIPFTVNPFAAFVLVHSILRDVFSPHGVNHHHGSNLGSFLGGADGSALAIQCTLLNWQRLWSNSPEAMHLEQQHHNVPFVHNAVPYYWLARYAEGAKQNGALTIDSRGSHLSRIDSEDRYRMIKGWLNQINATLRNGSQMSPSPRI
ncbi:hypothetical protein BDN70DRAFT_958975 [Pholiota conissans]|uniref:Uncharacterized protein n=1 Tax=Pholiota conissans TaxID=109636 RepID=A0A9P5ZAE7_9AGAR|nr:hypothetical protein BDN70DRAFT_958975 [Pholiota conissans]